MTIIPEQPISADDVRPRYFTDPGKFRKWLVKNHASARELWVGYHKKSSGKPSMTWPESVDQALCFGWIDGIRKSVDAGRYMIRFTPRRPGSNWSSVNLRRVKELLRLRLMHPAGEKAYERRDIARLRRYSFERKNVSLQAMYEAEFRSNKLAWKFFQAQAPWYRRTSTWWIMSARQETTRRRRLAQLIRDSASGKKIALMRRP